MQYREICSMNSKLLIILGIIALVLVSGCVEEDKEEISFETLSKGEHSTHIEKENLVIQDKETYYELWWGLFPEINECLDCGARGIQEIDFSEHTVIAVFMGEKNSGGYSIEIVKIVDEPAPPFARCGDGARCISKAIVYYKETKPGPDDIVTEALTQPYHIVKTEKLNRLVRFEEIR
jgi:hypothetical protein